MATISSAGIGSGLDVTSIVDKLVAIERQPIVNLQAKATTIQTKLSSFGLLSSYMANLGDIAGVLAKPTLWSQTVAGSSDAAAVKVSAGASAVPGSWSVKVTQLAQAQGLASKSYASRDAAVGSGSLRIDFGAWAGSTFGADAAKPPLDLAVTAGDTLDTLRTRINAANAAVTASIVEDAGGARLVLQSRDTGTTGAMRIALGPKSSSLAALAYNGTTTPGQMTQTQPAQDAQATIDGLAVTSESNTVTGAIEGVTLTLGAVTAAPVAVTAAFDTAAQRTAVKNFAKAFSDINTYIAKETKYDATTRKAAALQGDRATLGLQSLLRGLMQSASTASPSFSRLSDIGIAAQRDGSFSVDEAKLTAALADPAEVGKLFAATGPAGLVEGSSPQGYAVRAKALADRLSASDGLVTTTAKGLRDSIARNGSAQDALENRVAMTKQRLLRQYTGLDATISRITGTNNQLTQSLAGLTSLMTSIAKN